MITPAVMVDDAEFVSRVNEIHVIEIAMRRPKT